MNKKVFFILGSIMALLFMLPIGIQSQNKSVPVRVPFKLNAQQITKEDARKYKENQEKRSPNIIKGRSFENKIPMRLTRKAIGSKKAINKQIARTPDGTTIWGNVIFADSWASLEVPPVGMYSFTATESPTLTPMAVTDFNSATGGGVYYDGTFKYVNNFRLYGLNFVTIYSYDTETWQQNAEPISIEGDMSMVASANTYDPVNGKAYGCYYTKDGAGIHIAEVDYDAQTVKVLASTETLYIAFAANRQGDVYAISEGGDLFKVNKTNGEVTLIGATGVAPARYLQSAAFDMKTGKMYWAAQEADGSGSLYEVNIETGIASKIAKFPDNEEITCLYIPMPLAEDNAPAVATDVNLTFEDGSKYGQISFRAPDKTFSGNDLSEELDYKIMANGTEIANGKIDAGWRVTADVTAPAGMVNFTITTKNAYGESPKAKASKWIGYDIPDKPVVTLDITDGKSTVKWEQPEALNQSYLGTVQYDVIRYPENKKVADHITETTFTETLEAGTIKAYYYGVKAYTQETAGEEGYSNYKAFGNALEVPYFEDFNDPSSIALYTVLDVNGDEKTWGYNPDYKAATYTYNEAQPANDWLITPSVHLEPNYLYNLSYKVRAGLNDYKERIEVYYGQGNTAESMTQKLLDKTDIIGEEYKTYEHDVIVDADGNYNFGFHSISDADRFYLIVDSIKLVKSSSFSAPDVVNDLKVTPGDKGAMKAKIEFKAPTKNIAGNNLANLTKIEILRNGELIKTFNTPAVGSALSYDDNAVKKNGHNTYTVIAYNAEAGRKTEKTVFIGEDIPSGADGILIDGETKITIKWSPITKGQNGGYVNPDNVKYTIATIENNSVGEILEENISDTSYDVSYNTDEGEQKMIQYAINATGIGGESGFYATEGLMVGKAHELPFIESIAGYFFTNLTWWVSSSNPDNTFKLSKNSSDDDNGSLTWKANNAGEWASINSGKIDSKSGNANFSLVYDYLAIPGKDIKLDVLVQKPDGTDEVVKTIDFKTLTGSEEWRTDMVSLSKYVGERYIIVKFKYTSNEVGTELFIDNIKVYNMHNNNLEVKMKAPDKVAAGIPFDVNATITNSGKTVVNGCKLEVKVDGTLLKEENITESINPIQSKKLNISIPVPYDKTGTMKIEVGIVGTDDEPADNIASAEVTIEESNLPKPENFKAESLGGGVVKLTWDAPVNNIEKVSEDFSAYEPWIIENIGDWTLIDADKLATYAIFNGVEWNHLGDPQAFITYNLVNIGIDVSQADPDYVPHSGEQCLLSVNGKGENNNWLISPMLSGKAQTMKFWATSVSTLYPETFEVLYSMSGKDMKDFTLIEEYAEVQKGWKQYEVAIPEGARYFAIRLKSNDMLALLLDDVEFERGTAVPVSYNLYRDGAFLKNVDRKQLHSSDGVGSADGEHTYALTAVYPEGESAPVQVTVITAITTIDAATGETYTVYTVDGKLIGTSLKSLEKLEKGVYIINEKKVTIK